MLIIATWYVFNKTDIYLSSRFNSDEGFDLRISMFLTAFNHLRHFPFGMGNYAAMPQYIITIGNASASYIQEVGAHNLIANCAASYGLVGLLVFLDLYLVIICEFFQNKRKSFQYIGIFLGIVSLALNACVHNLYMLSGDLMSFLLIGLLLGTENGYRES
jgi:O-antigen ligase